MSTDTGGSITINDVKVKPTLELSDIDAEKLHLLGGRLHIVIINPSNGMVEESAVFETYT